MKNKAILIILAVFLISSVSATQVCQVYDDFSSGVLDTSKWDVRQDYEGWPFTEEYGIDTNLSNFHIKQNSIENTGTFLVPTHNFSSGEVFEFDLFYNSGEGNRIAMLLIDKRDRWGLVGYWNGPGNNSFGLYHVKLEFGEGQINLSVTNETDTTIIGQTLSTTFNGPYEVYIGVRTGHNGIGHFDFDNFELCTEQEEPPQPDLDERVSILEEQLENLTARVTILETLINKIKSWFWFVPYSIKRDILCDSLEETGEKKITEWGVTCELKELKKKEVCVCKKVR